ncbi:oxidoreductase, aldo/keto reductase family [Grimontia indica]|uniref:Oxidoreductase, aldo/keto reductase family n=1 Tax=Grimontia indica TaxID=1056512 RepID=R1IH91_9GAMM|nr:aldo/keto reductase [Grimontia indica]EOD80091.1 oxidoreductase, aldo/keto reductase family [Grimontia indica]
MNVCFQGVNQRVFGTYPLNGDTLTTAVHHAFEAGYRAFDTAQMYGNEASLGEALSKLPVKREALCITTKVHPDNFHDRHFILSVKDSLKALKLQYVDVLMLHWPPADGDVGPSLWMLEQAHRLGLAKHIAVSNYNARMMREVRKTIETPIVTNQVEFHPLLNQEQLLLTATETSIPLSSYCSVARGEIFKHSLFADIAQCYQKTSAQIALRWALQKGVAITTMSTKQENIRANFDVMDFTLSSIEMAKIDALTDTNMRIVTKELSPWAPDWQET